MQITQLMDKGRWYLVLLMHPFLHIGAKEACANFQGSCLHRLVEWGREFDASQQERYYSILSEM